jgi:hypothetical protein
LARQANIGTAGHLNYSPHLQAGFIERRGSGGERAGITDLAVLVTDGLASRDFMSPLFRLIISGRGRQLREIGVGFISVSEGRVVVGIGIDPPITVSKRRAGGVVAGYGTEDRGVTLFLNGRRYAVEKPLDVFGGHFCCCKYPNSIVKVRKTV